MIAVGNHLAGNLPAVHYSTRFLDLVFTELGFDGSIYATLSYEPDKSDGYIWLVDRPRARDCKGRWILQENEKYIWNVKCTDNLRASGVLSNPLNGFGEGVGKDNSGRDVTFVFMPRGE